MAVSPDYEDATMNAGYVAQWWSFAMLHLVGFVYLVVKEARLIRSATQPDLPLDLAAAADSVVGATDDSVGGSDADDPADLVSARQGSRTGTGGAYDLDPAPYQPHPETIDRVELADRAAAAKNRR